MSTLEIVGCGVVGAAGVADVTAMYEHPVPSPVGNVLTGFDVRAELGRKGTSFFDRRTALTVVSARRAIEHAGLDITDANRARVGMVVGTTAGSIRSSVDYVVETFTQRLPHMVNPALFPNTVMNCAAGQSAIWFGLNGVNATVAGGPMAFLTVLRYCANVFRTGRADHLLAGAVEEYTPHTAWLLRAAGPESALVPGEGGAMFVLRPAAGGPGALATIGGVTLGFCPESMPRRGAIAGCVRRALAAAAADPGVVTLAATGNGPDGDVAWQAIRDVFGGTGISRVQADAVSGDNPTGASAFELAALIDRLGGDPAHHGKAALLVAHSPEGAVGAAVIGGCGSGADRG